jgi:uncharacterized membrane protein
MSQSHSLAHYIVVFLIIAALIFVLIRQRKSRASIPSAGTSKLCIQRFRNPANGYEEECGTPWLWCLLFGCIYFAVRGIWTHAVAALLLAIFTWGLSWLIYPLFARQIVETHYLRRGWLPVT